MHDVGRIRSGPPANISLAATLRSFAYGHRTFNGIVEHFINADTSRLVDTLARAGVPYYKRGEIFDDSLNLREKMKRYESDPLLAAFSVFYRLKHDAMSTAPGSKGLWSQQPFEIDVYLPGRPLERAVAAASSAEDKYEVVRAAVRRRLRVGHAGAKSMLAEHGLLSDGKNCDVYDAPDVQSMMTFHEWMQLFGRAILYFRAIDEVGRESPVIARFLRQFEQQRYGLDVQYDPFESMHMYEQRVRAPMRFVIDLKCQTTSDILPHLVRALNRDYGVTIAAIGSFYRLPESIDTIDQFQWFPAITPTIARYTFFFGIGDLENGLASGRVTSGDTVWLTASTFLQSSLKDSVLRPMFTKTCGRVRVHETHVRRLRTVVARHRLRVGLWTQESEINDNALDVAFKLANDNTDLFTMGFAFGGDRDLRKAPWPIRAHGETCKLLGGRDWFPVKDKRERFASTK